MQSLHAVGGSAMPLHSATGSPAVVPLEVELVSAVVPTSVVVLVPVAAPVSEVVVMESVVIVALAPVVVTGPVVGVVDVPVPVVPGPPALVLVPESSDEPVSAVPELLPPSLVLPAVPDSFGPSTHATSHAQRHSMNRHVLTAMLPGSD